MAVIEFVQNYADLSTDHGFQFRFHCNHCGNGYQSTFLSNKVGVAGDLLRAAGNIFGGFLGNAGNSAYNIQRAIGGPAHDHALQEAVKEIKPLFLQCHRCGSWVCHEICWNDTKGLCKQCAPIMAEEMASAQARVGRDQVYQKATEIDQTQSMDASVQTSATCQKCGAASTGGKFCPECGAALVTSDTCRQCHAKIPVGAKFCPECGERN